LGRLSRFACNFFKTGKCAYPATRRKQVIDKNKQVPATPLGLVASMQQLSADPESENTGFAGVHRSETNGKCNVSGHKARRLTIYNAHLQYITLWHNTRLTNINPVDPTLSKHTMKNWYPSLILFLFLARTHLVSAQANGTLSGMLQDSKGTAVGFANVAVLRTSDSVAVTGAITDAAGNFAIKTPAAGQYLLRVSLVGFAKTDTPPFEITDENSSRNFGTLTLKENTKQLAEVKVQALRPTIVNHPDKMVVSVEGTALTAGNTAYDVLAKSPGVFVDQDGNIQLNGKAGVRIMIDGKLTYLSGKELQTMLQGMSAENLKDLEIITNPSAKYDAEGTAGIININLKKNDLVGLNGSVYGGGQFNGLHGFSGGGTINYKKGKWGSFAN
jgi:hypothetical protein